MTQAVAVILGAGVGERLGAATPKAFTPLAGTTMLGLATRAAERCPYVDGIVVVVPSGWERRAESLLPSPLHHVIVPGGSSRQESVRIALGSVPSGVAVVACHDAARPFASPTLFSTVLAALVEADGAVPVIPVPDTVKYVQDGRVMGTESREGLGLAQTPQAFALDALREAHAKAIADGIEATDDAALLERIGRVVRAVPGDPRNFKITTREDLIRAEAILTADQVSPRGHGRSSGSDGEGGTHRGSG